MTPEDHLIVNQIETEIALAIKHYDNQPPRDQPLAWFIAEHLVDSGYIRPEACGVINGINVLADMLRREHAG
jgi:hypothetical protein